jgi:hypothetical protein
MLSLKLPLVNEIYQFRHRCAGLVFHVVSAILIIVGLCACGMLPSRGGTLFLLYLLPLLAVVSLLPMLGFRAYALLLLLISLNRMACDCAGVCARKHPHDRHIRSALQVRCATLPLLSGRAQL